MFSFGYSFFLSGPVIRYTLPFIFNMFLSYSYLYTTSILHPSYLLNPTNLSNLSTQPYLNLCPFLLKNYPRYVPLYAYRGFESSGQIYFHFMKSSILKTFTTSLSRYQHNTLHMGRVDRIDAFAIYSKTVVCGNMSTISYVRGNISIDLLYFPLVSSFFSFNNL